MAMKIPSAMAPILTIGDTPPASVSFPLLTAPWMTSLKKALNHGGTKRNKRDRSEAKRKQLQLATVDLETGRPSVRTVVFRGFLPASLLDEEAPIAPTNGLDIEVPASTRTRSNNEESCLMTFVTDSRAAKVKHVLAGSSFVECCWWLDEAGVQYRISGRAVLCFRDSEQPTLRNAALAVWDRLGDSTKETFTWSNPGVPIPAEMAVGDDDAEKTASASTSASIVAANASKDEHAITPVYDDAHFCLFVVIPETVDELRLGGRQKRLMYRTDPGDISSSAGESLLPRVLAEAWAVEEVNP